MLICILQSKCGLSLHQHMFHVTPATSNFRPKTQWWERSAGLPAMAILHHYTEDENHEFCPKGPQSWCKFNADWALVTSSQQPCKDPLPPAIVEILLPIFRDLADVTLLASCSMALTQNRNECLHCVLWSLAPKEQFNSQTEIYLAADLAVLYFNNGRSALNSKIHQLLDIPLCAESLEMFCSMDRKRISRAHRVSQPSYKLQHQSHKNKASSTVQAFRKDQTEYKSGKFHVKSTKRSASQTSLD